MIKFEDVQNQTTEEFFSGNQFSVDAFNKKYALYEGETFVKAAKRVCDYISSCEKTPELRKYWSERWFDEIYNDWWRPSGGIMQGAASGRKISLANCTTLSLGILRQDEEWDNLESIIRNLAYTAAKCAAYRQGLGVEFSRLRPAKTTILNSAKESTGSIHWMGFIDFIGYCVGQKGRIPAMLFSLMCDHPDIMDFIKVKSDHGKIQNANISVQNTDSFYEAVEKDIDWELKFVIPGVKKGDRVYLDINSSTDGCLFDNKTKKYYYIATKTRQEEKVSTLIRARLILEAIAKNMTLHGEPGIQNIDTARKYSNSDYVYDANDEYDSRIISSNACVTGDTTVLTNTGYTKISSIVGKETIVWNGFEWSKVIPALTNKNQDIFSVTFSDGRSIQCTKYHSFVLADGHRGKTNRVKMNDLKIGDCIAKYNFPIIYGGKNIDKGTAYTQGFFSGDGDVGRRSMWLYSTKNCCLHRLVYKNIGIEILTRSNITKRCVTPFEDFLPKSFVPSEWDLKSRIEWLSGYFDADGTVLKEGGVQCVSIDREFLESLQNLLSICGVNSKVVKASEEGWRYLPDKNGNPKKYFCQKTWRILIGSVQIRELVKLGLNCSRLVLNHTPQRDATRFVTVTKIENLDRKEDVYCFNEPNRHLGCFNGIVTGQCSEQFLSRDSLCVLASLNLGRFSTIPSEYEKELADKGESICRFLDNVNEMELVDATYATNLQKMAIQKLRRIGAGYTNIGAWLFKHNLEYGTKESIEAIEKLTERYNYHLYKTSIALGKEKGNFGLFNREKFEKSPFVQRMMKLGLEFKTMRNVTCSSIAPTSTVSLMFKESIMSYGIEPSWGMYWWKRTRLSGKYEYYFCVPTVVRNLFKEKGVPLPMTTDTIKDTWDGKFGKPISEFIERNKHKLGIHFKRDDEVSAFDKLELMARVIKWIDSSISVTYNLPYDADWKDVYDFILLANKKELKSIAAFPGRRMYGIVSPVAFKDLAIDLLKSSVKIDKQNFSDAELEELHKYGILHQNDQDQKRNFAPERPKTLPCNVHHIKIHKDEKVKDYMVIVGMMNNSPYEVFLMKNGSVSTQKDKGFITKTKGGVYSLAFEDGEEIEDITSNTTDAEDCITRMVSTSLRYGTDILFIVQQLEKSEGNMWSIGRALSRTLKKYIPNGTKDGTRCPTCDSELIRHDGCATCVCGYSKCS